MPEVEEFRFLKKSRAMTDSSGKVSSLRALPHAECDSRANPFSPIFRRQGRWDGAGRPNDGR